MTMRDYYERKGKTIESFKISFLGGGFRAEIMIDTWMTEGLTYEGIIQKIYLYGFLDFLLSKK